MTRRHYGTIGSAPAPIAIPFERAEAIRGFIASGRLRVEQGPGTYARLAQGDLDAARNARGYVAYYETWFAETTLPARRADCVRWIGEQRAILSRHARAYLRWRREERRANRRVDELLKDAPKSAADDGCRGNHARANLQPASAADSAAKGDGR
ncbi:MAG TPA: hypothetical protein VGH28_14075 [Polyangiaceae bacterium]